MTLRCERHGVEVELGTRDGMPWREVRLPAVDHRGQWHAPWHTPEAPARLEPPAPGEGGLHACALLTAPAPQPGEVYAYDQAHGGSAVRPCRVAEVV